MLQLKRNIASSKTKSKKDESGKGKSDSKSKDKEKEKPKNKKPDWMLKPPGKNDPKKKRVDGKDYHWCPYHQAWTRHSPEECRLNPKHQSGGNKKGSKEGGKASKLAKALASVAEEAEQLDYSNEE